MNYTTTDDSSSSSSSNDKNEGKNYFNKNFTSKYKRDPYNILNQSRNASTVEIQRAYKRGSRALHPDKQQAKAVGVQQRNQGHTDEMDTIFLSDDDVQEAFIVLKEAYDILSDPCLRQAYDNFGHYGVEFVRHSLLAQQNHNKPIPPGPSLYHTLSSLHAQGKDHEALRTLKESIEFFQYTRYMEKYPTHASVELHCRVLDADEKTNFYSIEPQRVQMGFESLILSSTSLTPQQQQQQQSTGTPQYNNIHGNNRWSVILASDMSLKNGECYSQVSTRLECYEVQPKTDVSLKVTTSSFDDDDIYLTLSSTRILSTGTAVTVGAQAETTGKHPLALSLSTQRSLCNNSLGAALSLGMGFPNQKLNYISCSLTTLGAWPMLRDLRLNASLNVGLGRYPLKVSVRRETGNTTIHKNASFGLDPMTGSWEFKMISNRGISKYVNFGIGISDVSKSGLSLILLLQRGDHMTFKLPISIAKTGSSYYTTSLIPIPLKVARVGIMSFLLDVLTQCIVQSTVATATTTIFTRSCNILKSLMMTKKGSSIAPTWLPINYGQGQRSFLVLQQKYIKGRRESKIQLQLMAKTVEKKKRIEKSNDGLVLVLATYFIPGTGQTLDVTSQLQFWVKDSKLTIPGGFSKARISGFYDLIASEGVDDGNALPARLFVRYLFASVLYEITVRDMESLSIPNEHARRVDDNNKFVKI